MSIATKKPYIKEYIDALSDEERLAIITALNSSFADFNVYDLATGGPHTAISTLQNGVYKTRLYVKANENICGILIKQTISGQVRTHFIAISTGAFPYINLEVFEIVNAWLEPRDKYLSVDELRNYCVDGGQEAGKVTSVNGKTGVVILKDNDIQVYTDETGTKTVHSELVKHDEDLEDIHDLIPEEATTNNKLADKAWVTAQGGDAGTKLYKHIVTVTATGIENYFIIFSNYGQEFTTVTLNSAYSNAYSNIILRTTYYDGFNFYDALTLFEDEVGIHAKYIDDTNQVKDALLLSQSATISDSVTEL